MGHFSLHTLSDGFFGLDGGAMFGVIPKLLWEKRNPPDPKNRIKLALRSLLIVTASERILVDTGVGRKYGPKFSDMFNVDDSDNLLDSLKRAGFNPDDVTLVVQTHLHFDHCGWATRLNDRGRPVPTFPKARYIVQAWEWQDAVTPNRRTKGSYRSDDFLPLQEAGQLELVDGDTELVPGVRLVRTGGHTRGHQIVIVETKSEVRGQNAEGRSQAQKSDARSETSEVRCLKPGIENPKPKTQNPIVVFWGDLIPTTSHIEVPYIMGYDTYPLATAEKKEELVARAADENWLCFFEHDPNYTCGRIVRDGERYQFRSDDVRC